MINPNVGARVEAIDKRGETVELIRRVAVFATLGLTSAAALAQYPSKPITFIAAAAAGGDADLSGRNLAQHSQKFLNNQPVLVVNRPGASNLVGTMAVWNAAPDGYTLLVARTASHAILPAVDTKVPYKWNEFTMLSLAQQNAPPTSDVPRQPIRVEISQPAELHPSWEK